MSKNNHIKPKLPRKRKKAMIKVQGRKSYLDTIALAKATGETPCKFWDNRTIRQAAKFVKGQIVLLPEPTRYW